MGKYTDIKDQRECEDAAYDLLNAFAFTSTPEGHDFWHNIVKRLDQLSKNPNADYEPLNASLTS